MFKFLQRYPKLTDLLVIEQLTPWFSKFESHTTTALYLWGEMPDPPPFFMPNHDTIYRKQIIDYRNQLENAALEVQSATVCLQTIKSLWPQGKSTLNDFSSGLSRLSSLLAFTHKINASLGPDTPFDERIARDTYRRKERQKKLILEIINSFTVGKVALFKQTGITVFPE